MPALRAGAGEGRPAAAREDTSRVRAKAARAAKAQASPKVSAGAARAAALAFGVTGFAAMATQIGWTRALSLALGSSTYAFSLIVAIFILGLALGGGWGARVAARLADPPATLGRVLLLIGLLNGLVTVLLGWGPVLFFWLIGIGSPLGFGALLALEALGLGLLLLLPTFLMGATLPLTLQTVQAASAGPVGAGRLVGNLYAINTVGAILGSLAGGLVLLPVLHIQNSLKLLALLYTLPGLGLLLLAGAGRATRRPVQAGVLAAATVGLCFMPTWDPMRMNAGAYLLRQPLALKALHEGRLAEAIPLSHGNELIFHEEGATATVAVFRNPLGLVLSIGGKPDASTYDDMATQVGLTLVPLLMHPGAPEQVLVVGMGSGVSLGAALAPAGVRHADVVEISPEVIAASACFASFSGLKYAGEGQNAWLAEPKVEVLINDGRNHLAFTRRRYDVIASEPSNPWVAGIGNLFTREAFAACRRALKPGGIMCQWMHRYGIAEREFRSVVATFVREFPQAQLWTVLPGSDYLLVGSDRPLRAELGRLRARMEEPRVAELLKRVGFEHPDYLLACMMADTERLRALSAGAELHTDDNLLLEFRAPRTLLPGAAFFRAADWRGSPEMVLTRPAAVNADWYGFLWQLDLRSGAQLCFDYFRDRAGPSSPLLGASLLLGPRQMWTQDALSRFAGAVAPPPPPPTLSDLDAKIRQLEAAGASGEKAEPAQKYQLAEACAKRAGLRLAEGRLDAAEEDLARAEALAPKHPACALARVQLTRRRGTVEEVVAAAKQAKDAGVSPPFFGLEIALALSDAGRREAALAMLDKVLSDPAAEANPEAAPAWALRARLLPAGEDPAALREAVVALQRRVGLVGEDSTAWIELSAAELRLGAALAKADSAAEAQEERRCARRAAHVAGALAPRTIEPYLQVARAWRDLGELTAARAALEQARARGGPDFRAPADLLALETK